MKRFLGLSPGNLLLCRGIQYCHWEKKGSILRSLRLCYYSLLFDTTSLSIVEQRTSNIDNFKLFCSFENCHWRLADCNTSLPANEIYWKICNIIFVTVSNTKHEHFTRWVDFRQVGNELMMWKSTSTNFFKIVFCRHIFGNIHFALSFLFLYHF